MLPPLGGLVVEGAVNALEPATDRRSGGFVRQDVQTVGQNRVGRQPGDVVDAYALVLRRERPERPLTGVADSP